MKFDYSLHKNGIWFRINGKGLSITWDGNMLFSERNGYQKVVKIGKLKFKWLK